MKKPEQRSKRSLWSRRRFLAGASLAGAAFNIAPRYVLGGAGYTPPSERLNVALIGAGGRGMNLVTELLNHRDVQVGAIADVTGQNDYSAFYYRKPAGRIPVLKLVRSHYESQKETSGSPPCAEHVDFRRLLEKEKGLDAVVIATPDHVHAFIALAAIGLGKHVYCEKPLTRTVDEARRVTEAAREAKVATQMGNQGHSDEGIRLTCEWIWDGAIGQVREVHAWSDAGGWAGWEGFLDRPRETPPVPADLDWDLWLGPAHPRPYHPIYSPYNWRGWWDFGTGGIGDMACHNMDPAFWALRLGHPMTVEGTCTQLSAETTPFASTVHYEFPPRGDMPGVRLTWYDGGIRPPRPDELEPGEDLDRNGILLVGDRGKILCGGWSRGPRLIPRSRMESYRQPPKSLLRSKGHLRDWIDAAKGGPPASSNFDVGGHLAEVVLLGNVALRTGEKISWDGENLKATNCADAETYIRAQYRKGWTL
ncbi:MAG: Gfo/Idh/MocA family oxidoreductase [Planctomycetes bacterium]|nr:Gfo/Idh/MocA family oxidoreductase [Planctomycetota bacterium]